MKHWRFEKTPDDIVWLSLDVADSTINKLSKEVMHELSQVLDELDRSRPRGLIIASAKESGFVFGADIEEFSVLNSEEGAMELISRGWNLFNRLAEVPYPTLALIRGTCLGGGLEMSLACRYRIAVDIAATKLGLPEVLLGIVPAWGGMMRLPKLIGPQAALDLMLTAKSVDARRAKRVGLVDMSVPERLAKKSAEALVVSGKLQRRASGLARIANMGFARPIIAAMARKQVAKRALRRHYPAPYALIETWEKFDGDPIKAKALLTEITRSLTARNLLRVFFLQDRLKSFGKEVSFKARRVHVVGAGVMGGDIAAVCALRGLTVTIQDQDIEKIAAAIKRASNLFKKRIRQPLLRRDAMDRLIADPSGQGAAHADVVIEAIFENLDAKHALFKNLERVLKPKAVLASNTSSLRIEDIASVLEKPERLVGIHFFNPVPQMPLVEVIRGERSDPTEIAKALAFVKSIDKLPLPVKSTPGFLVNAVLAPYMLAAMRAVDQGVEPETIDTGLREFGMPMGPLELADTVGLDVVLAAGAQMSQGEKPPDCLIQRIAQNKLGKKNGAGFYTYVSGKPTQNKNPPKADASLVAELIESLVKRAEELVASGVVEDADLADAGIIFGTGFAPFLGGPLHWKSTLQPSK